MSINEVIIYTIEAHIYIDCPKVIGKYNSSKFKIKRNLNKCLSYNLPKIRRQCECTIK